MWIGATAGLVRTLVRMVANDGASQLEMEKTNKKAHSFFAFFYISVLSHESGAAQVFQWRISDWALFQRAALAGPDGEIREVIPHPSSKMFFFFFSIEVGSLNRWSLLKKKKKNKSH